MLVAAVVGLVTPSSSTVMAVAGGDGAAAEQPAGGDLAGLAADPTEVVVDALVSNTAELTIVDRLASDGNVIVILLFAVEARPPVDEVVNDTM